MRPIVSSTAIAAAVLVLACDERPTSPTRPPQAGSPSTAPTAQRLEISGPDSVPPGETAQFNATAYSSDASSRDVTNQALWQTTNQSVLTLSATGLATGHNRGEANVSAAYATLSQIKREVMVLPAGTFRLSGQVTDEGVPLTGAEVAVTDGPARGLRTFATPSYSLYGVSGDTEVRVTKFGYVEQKRRLQIASHQRIDFELRLSEPRSGIAGTYTMTVTADNRCHTRLPPEALSRRYTAIVSQQGPAITVRLEGSTFYASDNTHYNSFSGTLEPSSLRFWFNDPPCTTTIPSRPSHSFGSRSPNRRSSS